MSNSEETITWRVRPSETQKFYVLEFLEKHPHLVSRRRNWERSSNAQLRRELWDELTETLNNMGHACKTVDTWQKYWRDQRAFVRERYAAYMKSSKGNVHSLRNRVKPLNNYEQRVMALITPEIDQHKSDSDTEYVSNVKIKTEVDDEHSQLKPTYDLFSTKEEVDNGEKSQSETSYDQRLYNHLSSPLQQPSQSSSVPNIKIKSIRSLLSEEQDQCHRGSGKRIRLDRELERKTIALLEKNEEFNREMEIKKLEVEKEKVAALKELISVVRLGFACLAGQELK